MKLAIVTDSTVDLTVARQKELGLHVVPLSVHIGQETYEDWSGITPKEMFERVERKDAPHPTTSQPSPERFKQVYQQALNEGAEEILSIHISSGLSGTLSSATLAAKDFSEPIHLFDTQSASVGLAAMITRASQMRASGAEADAILKELERIRNTLFLRMILPKLEYLHKGGRIGGAQAFVGSILKMTPILTFRGGKVETTAKARGLKKAVSMMFGELKDYIDHHGEVRAFPVFGTEDSEMKEPVLAELSGMARVKLEPSAIGGSVIGVYGGPGWFGLAAYPVD